MVPRRDSRSPNEDGSTDDGTSLSRRHVLSASVGAAVGLAGCSIGGPSAGDGNVSPVSVEDGAFVRDGSATFPHGFNYVRVRQHPDGYLWHDTFNPERYDPGASESMFATLAEHGFTVVRVFVDHIAGPGVVSEAGATAFSQAYMANVFDFLGRARDHGVSVVLTFPWLPRRRSYEAAMAAPLADAAGANRRYLDPGHVEAKARYVADFAAAIEAHDAGLLGAVFGFDLGNEAAFRVDQPPFSLSEGTITPANGETYDLASTEELTRLADESIAHWIDVCAAGIRDVVPDGLVTVSVFPYNAVGREGPGDFSIGRDPRYPARPLALAGSAASHLDVHLYTAYPGPLSADLDSIEFETLSGRIEGELPLLMGEFGAFTTEYADRAAAATAMLEHWERVDDRGFSGYLYWTYEDNGQPLYGATGGDGRIFEALSTTAT